MEFGSPAAGPLAARVYDPSESSSHRIRVRVSGPVYHPSESESHPSWRPSQVSIEIQSTSNSIRGPTRVQDPSKSQIQTSSNSSPSHSAAAAQSIIHRKTVVIEFGSESTSQSILPGHSRSSWNISFQVIEIQTSSIRCQSGCFKLGVIYLLH